MQSKMFEIILHINYSAAFMAFHKVANVAVSGYSIIMLLNLVLREIQTNIKCSINCIFNFKKMATGIHVSHYLTCLSGRHDLKGLTCRQITENLDVRYKFMSFSTTSQCTQLFSGKFISLTLKISVLKSQHSLK